MDHRRRNEEMESDPTENARNRMQRPEPPLQESFDPNMMPTDDERRWALEIKEAFYNSSEVTDAFKRSTPDMVFVSHAIAAHGNVTEAVKRLEGLSNFATEYGINHTTEQALFFLRKFMIQQPGYLLHLDVSPITQQAWLITDSAAFRCQHALADDNRWKICVCGLFYMHYTTWTTLTSIRQGLFCEIECESVNWHNFNMDFITRLFSELMPYMPILFQRSRAYNTAMVANLLWSLAGPFMTVSQKESVQLGCRVVSDADETNGFGTTRRLSEFYLQPSVKEAMERTLQRAEHLLRIREHNAATFRL